MIPDISSSLVRKFVPPGVNRSGSCSAFWIGLIVALIGLVFFGGFARGKWY